MFWQPTLAVPACCCALAGVLAARYPPTYALAAVGLLAGAFLVRRNDGVVAALLVLLLLDGLPLISMNQSSREAGANTLGDLIFLLLVGLLGASMLRRERGLPRDKLTRWAFVWGAAYLGWWTFKVVAKSPGVPLMSAVSFGRDFMYFALLLPLALGALRRREQLVGFACTLGAAAGLYSLGLIAQQFTHAELAWLVHAEKTGTFEGLPRVYAPMNDLLIAAFPLAFAASLLGPRQARRWCAALAFLTGLGNLLTFTRAVYVSEILALVVISALWAARSRRVRRVLALLAALACATVILGTSSPTGGASTSPVKAVLSRVELAVTSAEEQNGTVAVRVRQTDRELQVLGSHWLAGLGFLSPAYHYFWGLREGSIRDDDLGSLNIIMTMGVIGLVLAYLPAVLGLAYLLKRRRGFAQYGGAMYLLTALVGSITLGTLSSVSGLLVLASGLVFCLNWSALVEPAADPVGAESPQLSLHGGGMVERSSLLPIRTGAHVAAS
jgi:hypothetical protein